MNIKLNYKIEISKIADMYVGQALDFETNEPEMTFRLNQTGVTIVKALQEGDDEEAVVAKVLSEFSVDESTAKAEIAAFIQMMIDNGLAHK